MKRKSSGCCLRNLGDLRLLGTQERRQFQEGEKEMANVSKMQSCYGGINSALNVAIRNTLVLFLYFMWTKSVKTFYLFIF